MKALWQPARLDPSTERLLDNALRYIEHLEELLRERQAEINELRRQRAESSLQNRQSETGIVAALQQIEQAAESLARQRLNARVGALGDINAASSPQGLQHECVPAR